MKAHKSKLQAYIKQASREVYGDPNRKISGNTIEIIKKGLLVGFYTDDLTLDGKHKIGLIYIDPMYRNQNIATEIAMDYLKRYGELYWFVHRSNAASIRVAEKVGLSKKGTAKNSQKTLIYSKEI